MLLASGYVCTSYVPHTVYNWNAVASHAALYRLEKSTTFVLFKFNDSAGNSNSFPRSRMYSGTCRCYSKFARPFFCCLGCFKVLLSETARKIIKNVDKKKGLPMETWAKVMMMTARGVFCLCKQYETWINGRLFGEICWFFKFSLIGSWKKTSGHRLIDNEF